MLNVKKTLTNLMNNVVKVESVSQTTATTVTANGGTAWTQVRCPSTINPLCVVGYYLEGGSGCSVYNMSLGHDSNGYYGSFALRNGQSSANSVKITAHFLCRGGGYSLTALFRVFSRLAERWWEYAEHKDCRLDCDRKGIALISERGWAAC